MMDTKLFIATFISIFVAELGDKTQFAAIAASAQSKSTTTILLAVVLALIFAGSIGVLAGKMIGNYIDPTAIKWVSGGLFILIGVWILVAK